jgi:hypothetical protein
MLFKDFPIPFTSKDGTAFTNYLLWEKAIWNNFIAAVLIFNNTAVFLMIMFTLKPPNRIWRFYLFRSGASSKYQDGSPFYVRTYLKNNQVPMAVLRNGSKCSHTTCMLRFFTVSRLALNTNLIFEIGSSKKFTYYYLLGLTDFGVFRAKR